MPCNFDRSQSVEAATIGFPGMPGVLKNLRIPFIGLSKKFLRERTYDDIFEVLSWSFRCLANATYPSKRHHEKDWSKTDTKRKKLQGQTWGLSGALVEVRGDWNMLMSVSRFPGWGEKTGCCFLCRCTPDQVRICGLDAPWSNPRMSHMDLMLSLLQEGKTISPLFSCPGL